MTFSRLADIARPAMALDRGEAVVAEAEYGVASVHQQSGARNACARSTASPDGRARWHRHDDLPDGRRGPRETDPRRWIPSSSGARAPRCRTSTGISSRPPSRHIRCCRKRNSFACSDIAGRQSRRGTASPDSRSRCVRSLLGRPVKAPSFVAEQLAFEQVLGVAAQLIATKRFLLRGEDSCSARASNSFRSLIRQAAGRSRSWLPPFSIMRHTASIDGAPLMMPPCPSVREAAAVGFSVCQSCMRNARSMISDTTSASNGLAKKVVAREPPHVGRLRCRAGR